MRIVGVVVMLGALMWPTAAAAAGEPGPSAAPACAGGFCEICPVVAQVADVFGGTVFCIA